MYIADLHIHSRFSRATSRGMEPITLSKFAKIKGVHLLGTGDVLHPQYRKELKSVLREKKNGVYTFNGVDFMLTVETSHVYSHNGRVRKIHILWVFPDFETVDRTARALEMYGNLESDGRPTFGLTVQEMMEIVLSVNQDVIAIPAHAWTPWFSIFGSNSGYDSIEEAFGNFLPYITAIETGLSSDPPMNWRVSALDKFALVSNSDAHSPDKIGREANIFSEPIDFYSLKETLKKKDKQKFLFTIEFFPEEGKYHYDGHRSCGICLHPSETRKLRNKCPVCGKPLTVGVLNRVEQLADRPEGFIPENSIPYKNLVPLKEIIAQDLGVSPGTKSVEAEYLKGIQKFGNELEILLNVPEEELRYVFRPDTVRGIIKAREGKIRVEPGYDGVYGKIIVVEKDSRPKHRVQEETLF